MRAVDIDGNYHEVNPDEVSWRIHVYGIVIKDGKILLSPQHGPMRYDLPGGKVDIDESLQAGLIREVREETGIEVGVVRQLDVRDNLFKVTFREPQETWHSVLVYYLCERVSGDISDQGLDDHEKSYAGQAEWVELSRLDDINPAASVDWRTVVRQVVGD